MDREFPLKTLLVAHSFEGGAGRAAHRLFQALSTHQAPAISLSAMVRTRGIPSDVDESRVLPINLPTSKKICLEATSRGFRFVARGRRNGPLSPAIFNTGLLRQVQNAKPDVVNLHWLGNNTLSIPEIGSIEAPIVWTLHDEWFFRGAEHYGDDGRAVTSYDAKLGDLSSLFDFNRLIWRQKKRRWASKMHLVAPSNWLGQRASESILGSRHEVHVIPNPLDLEFWKPIPRSEAAETLGIDPSKTYVLSGSLNPEKDFRKGRDLTIQVLKLLGHGETRLESTEVLFFGGGSGFGRIGRLPYRDFGPLDDQQLRAAYSLARVMLLTSRQENLPQTGTEATACGTPIVAFNVGGLSDVVSNGETGILVEPFDIQLMADSVRRIVTNSNLAANMASAARQRAVGLWSTERISDRYREVFRQAAGR